MTRGTYVNFHPFAYDDVYLRPQDYTGLTKVTSYPQPFWGIEGGTSWFKQFDFSWFFVSGAGVNYNPAAGASRLIGHEDQGNATLTLHLGPPAHRQHLPARAHARARRRT